MDLEPVTLQGEAIRLEPLSLSHLDDLVDAAEPGIFEWFTTDLSSRDAMRTWVDDALAAREARTALPFATVDRASERVIGSTRFGNAAPEHRRVEIGWTWLTPSHQRTRANTEAKYRMLRHAFETWGCVRVELKTDTRNTRSRDAIRRLGATEEGVLRSHMQTPQGPRDTVYYSILQEEWPSVKRDLEAKLAD